MYWVHVAILVFYKFGLNILNLGFDFAEHRRLEFKLSIEWFIER